MRNPTQQAGVQTQWNKRLCSLDENRQHDIAQKYYGGKYPWRTRATHPVPKKGD